jgi:hypothetical protein
MKPLTLLAVLALVGTSCSRLTTQTDMVFDPPLEGPATLDLVQKSVFDNSCALSGCHRNNVSPNLSAGRAYANIVNVESSRGMALVEPGDPDNSYLYLKILPDAEIAGRRMPAGGPYLTAEEIEVVRSWIERGAPDD